MAKNANNQVVPLDNDENFFNYAEELGLGDIHVKLDKESHLQAIVAIHNTNLGPAIGGCRYIEYHNARSAMIDAVRLAQGMAYKAAITGLPHGGGKSVIIKPPAETNREKMFKKFGQFLNEIDGRYLVAIDSGTTTADMDTIATESKHVLCTGESGDPAPYTSIGVRRSIEAAVKFLYGKESVDGLHIAIQGVGAVGYDLAKQLHERGAQLTITDTNTEHLQRICEELGAKAVGLDDIYSVNCDIFSPCALGAIINDETVNKIKAKIIAGSANNQLAKPEHGNQLLQREILYAPDYVANAGGLIYAASLYSHDSEEVVLKKVDKIYDGLIKVFERAHKKNEACSVVADTIAEEILKEAANK